jgi:hypothetical protein
LQERQAFLLDPLAELLVEFLLFFVAQTSRLLGEFFLRRFLLCLQGLVGLGRIRMMFDQVNEVDITNRRDGWRGLRRWRADR